MVNKMCFNEISRASCILPKGYTYWSKRSWHQPVRITHYRWASDCHRFLPQAFSGRWRQKVMWVIQFHDTTTTRNHYSVLRRYSQSSSRYFVSRKDGCLWANQNIDDIQPAPFNQSKVSSYRTVTGPSLRGLFVRHGWARNYFPDALQVLQQKVCA